MRRPATKKDAGKFRGSLLERIKVAAQEGMQRERPFYIGFKSGALNTSVRRGYTWKDKESWVSEGRYQEAVERSWRELVEIVDYITAEDPQALIILLGDHGSWRLRQIWSEANNLSELEVILQTHGESLESLADDIFGILMAVRMPDGARDISQGYPMSHVNLFRHIFAALSDDATLLRERQPSWSILPKGLVPVKEGIVQRALDVEAAVP
jgi:hypothetical protein